MFFQFRILLAVSLLSLLLSACSSSEEHEKKGYIEQATDKAAEKSIDYIKTPIEQAKLAKKLQESHNKMIEDAVKKQE